MSLKLIASFLSHHLWLWVATGAIGGLLAYAATGPSAAVIGGVIAGVAPVWLGAHLYDSRTSALSSAQDVTREGMTLLGAVGWFGQGPSAYPTEAHSEAWEAYDRLVRTLKESAGDARVFVVTSASPVEGKSTTAANLATTLAQDGSRVVLVDADLRSSSSPSSREEGAGPGLAGLLASPSYNPQEAIVRSDKRNLYLLPSGKLPAEPETLLRGPRLRELLDSLREMAGYVVIDAPPVLETSDVTLLAEESDGTIVIVEAGRTRRNELARALRILTTAGVPVIGAVLNRAAATLPGGPAPAVEQPSEPRSIAGAWSEARLVGLPDPEESWPGAAAVPVEFPPEGRSGVSTGSPRLRLVQPYERPLLPFTSAGVPEASSFETDDTRDVDEGSLEITSEELLVDLEETLSLIRLLREKHGDARGM